MGDQQIDALARHRHVRGADARVHLERARHARIGDRAGTAAQREAQRPRRGLSDRGEERGAERLQTAEALIVQHRLDPLDWKFGGSTGRAVHVGHIAAIGGAVGPTQGGRGQRISQAPACESRVLRERVVELAHELGEVEHLHPLIEQRIGGGRVVVAVRIEDHLQLR